MSKFKPYEDQIRDLINQGFTIKDVNDILISQGVDSNYTALHWFCRSYGITPVVKKNNKPDNNIGIEDMAKAARRAGMTYGKYVGMLYAQKNRRKK